MTRYEMEQAYKDFLDDTSDMVRLNGKEYKHSEVFKIIDPKAYRCGLYDFMASEFDYIQDTFEEVTTIVSFKE